MANEEREDEGQVDAQKQYLVAKINELIDGVGPGYSEALMEELITRLERTVAHFHEEVTELLEDLKSRAQERAEKLQALLTEEEGEATEEAAPTTTAAEEEVSEWEKRIEATQTEEQTESEESQPSEKEKPKKKGLFGRKKE